MTRNVNQKEKSDDLKVWLPPWGNTIAVQSNNPGN